jgi:predicted 2-oxoglutarate/Fe(II)-dependent dioxygenase YbiX
LPADIDGYEPIGLNERFRFYRYKDGQQFKPHVDGSFKRSETETSKITLLIYLNEDFEGGNTTLVLEGEEIVPKEGMLFLFEQKIMHCGRPVTTGTKYVLRTDVMYRLKR